MEERSNGKIWTGRILSGLVIVFLLMDAVMKFVKPAPVIEACVKLGLPLETITPIGVLLLICTLLYIVPRTAVAGALLLTGYLGGAVAINLRAQSPLFSNVLCPVYLGGLMWAGLYVRDLRVRQIWV